MMYRETTRAHQQAVSGKQVMDMRRESSTIIIDLFVLK